MEKTFCNNEKFIRADARALQQSSAEGATGFSLWVHTPKSSTSNTAENWADNVVGLTKSTLSSERRKADSVHHLRTTGTLKPMKRADIEILDTAMRNLEWMLEVWAQHFNEQLFCRYFKNLKYKDEVIRVLGEVRALVHHYLRRGKTALEKEKYSVRFIKARKSPHDVPDTVMGCTMRRPERLGQAPDLVHHDIILFPSFYRQSTQIKAFALNRKEPGASRYAVFGNYAEATILHELCHAVTDSRAAKNSMVLRTGIDKYIDSNNINLKPKHTGKVIDVSLLDFQSRSTASDKAIIDHATRQGNTDGYGALNTQSLALMRHGAEAALHNADSYTWCVLDTATRYMTAVLRPDSDKRLLLAYDELVEAVQDVQAETRQVLGEDEYAAQLFCWNDLALDYLSEETQGTFAWWEVKVKRLLRERPVRVDLGQVGDRDDLFDIIDGVY